MRKAIIIGASSGIGRALAIELDRQGYSLGLSARRIELLETLKQELKNPSWVYSMDVANPETSIRILHETIQQMKGIDLLVLNAGIGAFSEIDAGWQSGQKVLQTNALGIGALMEEGLCYFESAGFGHITVISSVSAVQASPWAPAYSASKACISNYMKGLRIKNNTNVSFTDIRPGFVDTDMIKDVPRKFFTVSCQDAASDIVNAIHQKKKVAYIPRKWFWLGWVYRILPDWGLKKIYQVSSNPKKKGE